MEDIPFSCIPVSVRHQLIVKLNPIHQNNWKILGEKLAGYTQESVMYIESLHGDKSFTERMFDDYMRKDCATVGRFREALKEMDRADVITVLDNHREDIVTCYEKNRFPARTTPGCVREPVQNSCNWSTMCSHQGSICSACCMPGNHATHHVTVANTPYSTTNFQISVHQSLQPPPTGQHGGTPGHTIHRLNSFPNQNGCPHPHPYFSGQYCPHVIDERSDSLLVHNEVGGHPDISLDIEMVDSSHCEEVAQLPQTIMRGENQLPSYEMSMGQPSAIDVGREEVVKTTGEQVEDVVYNRTQGQVGRPPYFQQQSEEANYKQPTEKRRAHIITKIVNNDDTGFSPESRCGSSPPICKLKKIANIPHEYQPSQDYKNIVADQKVEDRNGVKSRPIKEEKIDLQDYSGYNFLGFRNTPPRGKNGVRNETFPRVKAHSPVGSVVGDVRGNHSNSLTKSISMPVDMKPAEFRKAFRYIKVFVTYSNDNKKHLQKVLSLCNCLVKNGFSCCVDINSRYVSTLPNQQDKVNWYREKFRESDFILVCPSLKYKQDIVNQEPGLGTPVPENQLHTRYIYRLMQEEYEQQGKNTRFIPVIFEGISDELLPNWLQMSLKYRWPGQFKDLLWMLTRPEDRIKPKARLYSESNSQSNSPHHDAAY